MSSVLFDVSSTIIALVLVVTSCVLVVQGKSLPDQLVQWTWIVIGAHFGVGGIKTIVGNTVSTMSRSGGSTTTTTNTTNTGVVPNGN